MFETLICDDSPEALIVDWKKENAIFKFMTGNVLRHY